MIATQVASIADTPSPAAALVRLLDELSATVMVIPTEVRHALDHVSSFLSAGRSDTLSYDRRQRGTAIEADPGVALQQIFRLKAGLERRSTYSLHDPIRVTSMVSADGTTVSGWSTLARELAFVVSHTIHHQAIIGILLAKHGFEVPERFGRSPSTPRRN